MPIETYQDPSSGLIIQRVIGELCVDEVVTAQRKLYVDEQIDPKTPVLWDARSGDPSDSTFSELAEMADQSRDFWSAMSGGKTAIVTKSRSDFGMGRMYEGLTERMPREVRVFMDYPAAVEWLLEASDSGPGDRG